MTETIQSTDLRRHIRKILDRVRFKREPIIVQSYGTPQVVLIPYEDFAAYCEWHADRVQQQTWLAELRKIAEEVSSRAALTDEQAAALIEETKRG